MARRGIILLENNAVWDNRDAGICLRIGRFATDPFGKARKRTIRLSHNLPFAQAKVVLPGREFPIQTLYGYQVDRITFRRKATSSTL